MIKTRSTVAFLMLIAFLATSSLAFAGTLNLKKIKRWPDADKTWAIAMDAWMTAEELDVFIKIKDSDERKAFLKDAGYWSIWEAVRDEYREAVLAQEVIKGMNKNEVFMAWDKPKKIRKDFRRDAYVDVFNYEFERDRKGREFVMRPDSQTAYKNENFIRFVYMHNGEVFAIVDEGYEEDVMDELPGKDAPEETPAQKPEATPTEGEGAAAPETETTTEGK
jgi:hypothetical protein